MFCCSGEGEYFLETPELQLVLLQCWRCKRYADWKAAGPHSSCSGRVLFVEKPSLCSDYHKCSFMAWK
ncbi:hypothetical protein XENOCAPTIV_025528 [Xenoophorus captivus]|uniref:Uncharacterized protein n=1 Tax=Xenoophorus captivus TaxID=1517983 RepID=A0ABV0RDV8_9TELE